MNKNSKILLIVGALILAVGVGYMMSKNNEPDLSIKVNENGIEIDGK